MPKPNLHIQVPNPCTENFREMPVQGEGRFCAVCNKCVTDFTQKTDRELVAFFTNKPENACGFFRPDQLNRNILVPAHPPVIRWKAFFLAALAAFSVKPAQAIYAPAVVSHNSGDAKTAPAKGKTLTISGTVKNQQGEPLAEAFISYKGQTGFIAFTNEAGRFSFKVPVSRFKTGKLQLKVARAGYFSFAVTLKQPKPYNLTVLLKADANAAPPVLPVVEIIKYGEPLGGGGEYMPTWNSPYADSCQDSIPSKKLKFFPRVWKGLRSGFKKKGN